MCFLIQAFIIYADFDGNKEYAIGTIEYIIHDHYFQIQYSSVIKILLDKYLIFCHIKYMPGQQDSSREGMEKWPIKEITETEHN